MGYIQIKNSEINVNIIGIGDTCVASFIGCGLQGDGVLSILLVKVGRIRQAAAVPVAHSPVPSDNLIPRRNGRGIGKLNKQGLTSHDGRSGKSEYWTWPNGGGLGNLCNTTKVRGSGQGYGPSSKGGENEIGGGKV